MKLGIFDVLTAGFDSFAIEFAKSKKKHIAGSSLENKIISEGLYHFTSNDTADKILESGFIKRTTSKLPGVSIVKNHGRGEHVFMFAGIPDVASYKRNLRNSDNPFITGNLEFTAIKLDIKEDELNKYKSKYKSRIHDDIIMHKGDINFEKKPGLFERMVNYKGQCEIDKNRVKKIGMVMDLDLKGEYYLREKTKEEYENKYQPTQELLNSLQQDKKGYIDESIENWQSEKKLAWSAIGRELRGMYTKITGIFNKNKALPEGNIKIENEKSDDFSEYTKENKFVTTLKNQVIPIETLQSKEYKNKTKQISDIDKKNNDIAI